MTLVALAMSDDLNLYPGVSSYRDRHGKTRYRYRRRGVTRSLPGEVGSEEFENAYFAAIEGRANPNARIIKHPKQAVPESLGAAWFGVKASLEWQSLDEKTRYKDQKRAEDFLLSPVVPDGEDLWKDQAFVDLRRRHVKAILNRYSDTPHKARQILVTIRKMALYALDQDWIDNDPTHRVVWNPKSTGSRAWTDEERAAFEARHKPGSLARTTYSIALWLGLRVSDTVRLKWSDIDFDRDEVRVETVKGFGKHLVLPLAPELKLALMSVDRTGEYVLMTNRGAPFSSKSVTGKMARWTSYADLPNGLTMHGLRKTLGKMIAEADGTTRELMETLGHSNIQHAELYSRDAEQRKLAASAMSKVVQFKRRG